MIGFASSRPGSQRVPSGLGLLFPDQVRKAEERGGAGDFLAVLGNDPRLLEYFIWAGEVTSSRMTLAFHVPIGLASGDLFKRKLVKIAGLVIVLDRLVLLRLGARGEMARMLGATTGSSTSTLALIDNFVF